MIQSRKDGSKMLLEINASVVRGLFENAHDAIFILAPEQEIVLDVNKRACEIYGFSRSEFLGMSLKIISEDIRRSRARIQEVLEKKDRLNFETIQYRKDGSKMFLEINASVVDYKGQRAILSINRNVTERKRMEETLVRQKQELERSHAELAQLAYVASHNLKEPLVLIDIYTQLLTKRYQAKLDAEANQLIRCVVNGVKRVHQSINDLSAYVQVGLQDKDFEPTDCKSILDDALGNLCAAVEESGALITHDCLPTVIADRSQLGRLFQNLISNAIKFSDKGPPRVHISAMLGKEEWLFSVRDNGVGIRAEDTDSIFAMFKRLNGRSEYSDTGIGLAICEKIVEHHGGRIWVESELGKGATFYFTIPSYSKSLSYSGLASSR
jgi:PAS domain S-box-containing protein